MICQLKEPNHNALPGSRLVNRNKLIAAINLQIIAAINLTLNDINQNLNGSKTIRSSIHYTSLICIQHLSDHVSYHVSTQAWTRARKHGRTRRHSRARTDTSARTHTSERTHIRETLKHVGLHACTHALMHIFSMHLSILTLVKNSTSNTKKE